MWQEGKWVIWKNQGNYEEKEGESGKQSGVNESNVQ